jgi:hypothetical protein
MRYRFLAMAATLLAAANARAPAQDSAPERPRIVAELGAGPIIGLESPLRGASAGLLVGLEWGRLEAGLRAGAAYDRALGSASLRLDLELGLGGGLRVVAGGIIPLSPAVLEPEGAALPLDAAAWPSRFGLSSRLVELDRGPFGSRVAASASMIYSAYRVACGRDEAAAALSGAAAFAACVEVGATISLEWGRPRDPP